MTVKVELFFEVHSTEEMDPNELEGLITRLVVGRIRDKSPSATVAFIMGDKHNKLDGGYLEELTQELRGTRFLGRSGAPTIVGVRDRKSLLDHLR